MKLRKSWAWKSVAVMGVAGILVGCAAGSSPDAGSGEGKTEITFLWLWGEAEDQVLRELVDEFNEIQDEIHVTGVSSPDTVKQLAAMTSTNGSFDVSDFFGNATASWAEMGILEPLDEYIERDGFDTSDFIAPALDQNKYEGKTWALPVSTITQQLYYNADLLAEAGFDGPPETMEEFAEMTQALTKVDENGKITQLGLWSPWAPVLHTRLAYAMGGSFYGMDDGANGPDPDNAGSREALAFYQENVIDPHGADAVNEFVSGFGANFTAEFPFYNGKVAMMLDGAFHNAQIPTFAPDLAYGVAPIPYPADKPELAGRTGIDNSTIFIPSNSRNKDAAWEFVKFMYQKENILRFNLSQTNLPPFTSAIDDPIFDDSPEGFKVFLKSLESDQLVATPAQPWNPEYSNELNVIFEGVSAGRTTPDESMSLMKETAAGFR